MCSGCAHEQTLTGEILKTVLQKKIALIMPHETSKILYVLAMLCYDYKYVQADIAYPL